MKRQAFDRLIFMVHRTQKTNVTSMQEPVYRDPPPGKLEEQVMVDSLNIPLQEGFYSDSKARFPIAIDYLSTFAFEQGIIVAVPFANSTAVTAPFTGVIGINDIKSNVFVKTSACKNFPERVKRDTHNFFVESFSFGGKTFKGFNGNIRCIPQSHFSNIPDNFPKPVPDKVMLPCLEFFKASFSSAASSVGKGLQFFPSLKNLFSFNPNVFPKISLLQDFAVRRKNRNRKALAVNVNPQNIFSFLQYGFIFGKISNYFKGGSKTKSFALPTISDKRTIPLIIPVLLDWNSKTFSWIHSKFNKMIGFCRKGFTVTGNIELDSDSFNGGRFAFNDIAFNVTNHLGIKRGVLPAC